MNLDDLKRRLAARQAALKQSGSSPASEPSIQASPQPDVSPPGKSAESVREREPEIPDAIKLEMERGLGWPKASQRRGLALPGRGPLTTPVWSERPTADR